MADRRLRSLERAAATEATALPELVYKRLQSGENIGDLIEPIARAASADKELGKEILQFMLYSGRIQQREHLCNQPSSISYHFRDPTNAVVPPKIDLMFDILEGALGRLYHDWDTMFQGTALYVPKCVNVCGGVIALRQPWYELDHASRVLTFLGVDDISSLLYESTEQLQLPLEKRTVLHTSDPKEAFSFLIPERMIGYWRCSSPESVFVECISIEAELEEFSFCPIVAPMAALQFEEGVTSPALPDVYYGFRGLNFSLANHYSSITPSTAEAFGR